MNPSQLHNPLHIVCLGESGFPYQGRAALSKLTLICKGLVAAGDRVTVLNRKGVFGPESSSTYSAQGVHEGIAFIYASRTPYRPKGFVQRNKLKLWGSWREFSLLYTYKRTQKLDFAFVSTHHFSALLYYSLLSKILGFKILYNFVELRTAMSSRKKVKQRINDQLLKLLEFKLVDAVLPISERLVIEVQSRAPQKPLLKVPIICDFDSFQIKKTISSSSYYLYCGSLDYYEVIEFILKAFESLPEYINMDLTLVVGGTEQQKEALSKRISQSPKKHAIKTFSKLPYLDLVHQYTHAAGLLIPLRPTLQDEARFPHKIGEYLASGNPIITTHYGEVKQYFTDEQDALIASSYDLKLYTHKMSFISNHPKEAREIGLAGQRLGRKHFDYLAHGQRLHAFASSLIKKQSTPHILSESNITDI